MRRRLRPTNSYNSEGSLTMPEKRTIERAKKAKRAGKSASTQAGEFVREEFHHIREGKHGARSAKQAIAIGLSQARRAGVDLPPPPKDKASERTRKSAENAWIQGQKNPKQKPSRRRSRTTYKALQRKGRAAASHRAISRQAHAAAKKRTATDRSMAAERAARTKGPEGRRKAAQKAARTRAADSA
jgi:hypothetical protein